MPGDEAARAPSTGTESVARAVAGTEALAGQLLVALLVFVLTRNVTWSE